MIASDNTGGVRADGSMHPGPGEYMPTPDIALATRKVTRAACLRMAEEHFRPARRRRSRLTAVYKANLLRQR